MTNKEVQQKLKAVTNPDWFRTLTANFNYSNVNLTKDNTGFIEIYKYVKRQVNGWEKVTTELPTELALSKKKWNALLISLNSFLSAQKDQDQPNNLTSSWHNIRQEITQISAQYFPIDCPEIPFLLEAFKISSSHYTGAFKYLIGNSSLTFNNQNEFAGAILAYEYSFEESLIPKRRNSEKSSIAQLRNYFEKELSDSQDKVNEFLKKSEDNWNELTSHIAEKSRNHNDHVSNLVSEGKEDYETWLAECKKNDQDYTKHQLERAKELEELYQEKLKLEAPAQYWRKRATQLKTEGNRWLTGLVIVSIVAIIALGTVLFFISDGTLKDLFSATGSAIRWSIVFVTFVSFLAYAIRIFAKLTFSAYHLFRDAEEREQLAYVYLALKKEKNIDDTERHLIMQSLFSRADSGLLRDDSSPTMPGGSVIEKIMGGRR
jgi:flagellar biosynthesis GTPase FlhF